VGPARERARTALAGSVYDLGSLKPSWEVTPHNHVVEEGTVTNEDW
jgi:hypothetical protein